MSLSNTVFTYLIDPQTMNQSRAEFKLDDRFYSSAWKLIDAGIADPNKTNASGVYYPSVIGVIASLKALYLYSGSTLIDQITDIQQMAAVQALLTSNQGSEDLNRDLLLNGMGLRAKRGDGALTFTPDNVAYYNDIDSAPAQNLQVPVASKIIDAQSGAIMLNQLLKFLGSTPILPRIPDLRLVIEWNTRGADYFLDPAHTGGLTEVTPYVIRPTLIVDEILGMNPADAKSYNIPYLSTIVERFPVPEVKTPDHVSVPLHSSFRSQAFTQKFLKDITFFNYFSSELPAADQWLKSKTRSPAQKAERLQLVVNNVNHLPDRGIDSAALKYHFFNDAQGQLNIPLIAGLDEVRDASNNILAADSEAFQGQFSVTSVKVGRIIDDLRIEYERLYGGKDYHREAFTLLAFGTVARNLEVKDGRVRVSY